jgi:hypothetical protein
LTQHKRYKKEFLECVDFMVEKEFDSTDEKEEIKIRLSALIKPKLFAPGL